MWREHRFPRVRFERLGDWRKGETSGKKGNRVMELRGTRRAAEWLPRAGEGARATHLRAAFPPGGVWRGEARAEPPATTNRP